MAQTRSEWEKVKAFVEPVFVEIDRPGDDSLLTVRIDVNGDSSSGVHLAAGEGLSPDQVRRLALHAADLLVEQAKGLGDQGMA